ncbi:MAG: hypothetical protein KJO36_09860 [Acidimicrobiia bacterium]|nr:hypothetical protein [Acidimicrobiia bacterium]
MIEFLATDWSWAGFLGNIWWSVLAFVLGALFGRPIYRKLRDALKD